jgi:dTDP-4-amino-4,6-dideoxygalactose transaminase
MDKKLAINGGVPVIKKGEIHGEWPPKASREELEEIANQRNLDIGIKGRTGSILEFEEMFLEFMEFKVKYAVSFNSGTSALFAAFVGIDLREGDEVIGPALTYHAALSPLHILKVKVILADVDKDSRCISVGSLKKLITPKTKAIVVVHQWGHPADMEEIMILANKHNLKVIEDCSHAHGSRYKNKLVGTFGDVAAFSLQTNKAIFAGEGGILVTNNESIKDRATLLGHYRDRSKEEIHNEDFRKYWVTGFGLKLRMSPFNAIVAKYSLKNFNTIMENRHRCMKYLSEQIKEKIEYIEPPVISRHVFMGAWYGYKPLYIAGKLKGISREDFVSIAKAEGLQIKAPSGGVLSEQPLYHDRFISLFPQFERNANNIASTPNASKLECIALSFPVFSDWENDKETIDKYIYALEKIQNLS